MQPIIDKVQHIPQNILTIDGIYTVKLVLSNQGNGQGKVFLVQKQLTLYAAKVFFLARDFNKENHMLNLIENFEYIVKKQYGKVDAEMALQNGAFIRLPVIVFELMQNGDLCDYVCESQAYGRKIVKALWWMPLPVCKRLLYGLLKGLQEVQKHNIIHRDLKPQNLLFDANFTLKIADFGLSALHDENLQAVKIGTRFWYAPEIQASEKAHPKSDNFVLGLILYYMGFYSIPFQSTNAGNVDYSRYDNAENVDALNLKWASIQNKGHIQIPQNVKEFLIKIFKRNIEDRPSVQEILESNLFADMASPEVTKQTLETHYLQFKASDPKKLAKVNQIKNLIKQLKDEEQQRKAIQTQQHNNESRSFGIVIPSQFSLLLSSIKIDSSELPTTDNIYKQQAFTSPPSFIIAWVQYSLNQSLCSKSLSFLTSIQNTKMVAKFSLHENKIFIMYLFYGEEDSNFQGLVTVQGELYVRDCDGRVEIKLKVSEDDFFIGGLVMREVRDCLGALEEYQRMEKEGNIVEQEKKQEIK